MTDEASITPLRVSTWNLNHWQQPLLPTDTRRGAWAYLAERMNVQVALVQEAVPPAESARTRAVYGEIAGHRNWGSAVVALDPSIEIEPIRSVRSASSKRRFILDASHPGSTAVARVTAPGLQPITFVSVYGIWDGDPLGSMHRVVADLLPLFDSADGARVILGGDLNVTQSTRDARYRARADALLAAVEALGLDEVKTIVAVPPAAAAGCACGEGGRCGHIGTWKGAELDHLYVSRALSGQVAALAVASAAVKEGLSDHVPLVLDLALRHERTPHAWDEEAFAVEVGRRHGPRARGVVEALVSWAEHKERSLAKAAGVTGKVLTRFPTNGITADPELMFPIDIQAEPRDSQMSISIHADGTVVVWLGSMKVPPFDTTEARDELRHGLNEIDGVHIHRWETDRWPRFTIERLEDPSNLHKLVALLDRIADETRMTVGSRSDPAAAAAAEIDFEAVSA
jgi:endonuclease/exonuclease/phosphatase family metal-dependent hydrolase